MDRVRHSASGTRSFPVPCARPGLARVPDAWHRRFRRRRRRPSRRHRRDGLQMLAASLPLAQAEERIETIGSGRGSVGKAVSFDTRSLQFESRHRQSFYWILFTVNCMEKTKIKKRGRERPNLKKNRSVIVRQFAEDTGLNPVPIGNCYFTFINCSEMSKIKKKRLFRKLFLFLRIKITFWKLFNITGSIIRHLH